ncbi:hypothetical protein [Streptomyces sp. NPDC005568]
MPAPVSIPEQVTWPEAAKTSSWPTTERAAVPTALPPSDLFA